VVPRKIAFRPFGWKAFLVKGGIEMENVLDVKETQIAIKKLKDFFENTLAKKLNLVRVSAPLFVRPESGLNDNLSGKEEPVSFTMRNYEEKVEIVQSLAKWKRMALKLYDFKVGEGLYTDMNAIRPSEKLDNIHSIYVDQWDWEKTISKSDRNEEYLKQVVEDIYEVFLETEKYINKLYPFLTHKLPDKITFITSQELEDMYPKENCKKREHNICKEKGAVFLMKIGGNLKSGKPHDGRAPDYDDWELNGDILFWDDVLNQALELSSMGIRVDSIALIKQLKHTNSEERLKLKYHKLLAQDKLPFSIGGGIGQSRICMYFLEKQHIGEVQASVWTDEILSECREKNIFLL